MRISDWSSDVCSSDLGFSGRILDYASVAARALERGPQPFRLFRGVMPSWDNTARRGLDAKIFVGSTPALYGRWLADAIDRARAEHPPGGGLVFVNAWNEWAEGAYLEPDQRYGHAYLEATSAALRGEAAQAARRRRATAPSGARQTG